MKEQMMYWQNGNLIVTPNKCYASKAIGGMITGLCFGVLSGYLAFHFQDFWQLPFAIGIGLMGIAALYKFFSADIRVLIPRNDAALVISFGIYFKRNIGLKDEMVIVQNALNGRSYFAIANKSNPYGRSYQISPFLSHKKRRKVFEKEVLPVIEEQLKRND
ncbi:hypothetical protein JI747_018635 [Chryseobacterium sp. RG1]|uniref:Uncharacterized protein n=1 Tax=Chryseobacterium tagetis TaxID=2801334 RepID=A0ABS8A5D9_9FLAO|nr:hypothetical protein [Chryseobacterium tagetis]MCA6069189.1 hypothetical protein [Chryseobacterium tagetis]